MHCPCNSEPLARAHPGPVPPQCPRIVALLAESFNPHVRYGAAMAVGIACAGSGGREAVALLEGMAADGVDFVRQARHAHTGTLGQAAGAAARRLQLGAPSALASARPARC